MKSAQDDPHKAEAVRFGQALKRLRQRAGMNQDEAAAGAGVEIPTWSRWETAANRSLLNVTTQSAAAGALGLTRDDLVAEAEGRAPVARPPMSVRLYTPEDDAGLWQAGEDLPVDLDRLISSPSLRTLRLPNDDIAPVAEQGAWVAYETRGIPRKGQYVVVARRVNDAVSLQARKYLRHDDAGTWLAASRRVATDQGEAWGMAEENVPRAEIAAIYPITMWGY